MVFVPNTYAKQNPFTGKINPIFLDPVAFNALLADHGSRLTRDRMAICPNIIGPLSTGQHDRNCTACENNFIAFNSKDCFGLFFKNNLIREFRETGFWDQGTTELLTPSNTEDGEEFFIHYGDRITLLDEKEPFPELIERQMGDVDKLRYFALEVEYLIGKDGTIYDEDIHFKINEEGNIHWVGNQRPSRDLTRNIGDIYSIVYYKKPVYRVVEIVHEGRYAMSGVKSQTKNPKRFPQHVIIKKDYLITKRDMKGYAISEGG